VAGTCIESSSSSILCTAPACPPTTLQHPLAERIMSKRFNADYGKTFDTDSHQIGDDAVQLLEAKARRQRRIATIERRIGTPPLKARNWYRVTEIVAHSAPDQSPQERSRLLVSFASSLQAGIFDGGRRQRSQIFFAQPEPRYGFRLTDEFLTNRLKIFESEQPAKVLEPLLAISWIPRRFVVPWLMRTRSRIPEWMVAEAVMLGSKGKIAEKSKSHRISRAPPPPPSINGFGSSPLVRTVVDGSCEWFKRHFPGLPEPMVAAAISVNEGTCSPLDAAKALWDLRASPQILTRIFRLPHSALVDQTCSLLNLEDEPFRRVVSGEVPPSYGIIVGLAASHDGKLQSDLFALLMERRPEDEEAETIVRHAIEEWAQTASRELKRQHAERTFADPYWRAGAVLSWIAYRDPKLICQFEARKDWGAAKLYNHSGPEWKVDKPDFELIRALQDDRLRASRQKSDELPVELPPIFWARKVVRDLFAIDPDFRRADVLELWRDGTTTEGRDDSAARILPERPRGPAPKKSDAAAETLRHALRNGTFNISQLILPVSRGGLKQESLTLFLGLKSRSDMKKVVAKVLEEPEFKMIPNDSAN